MDIQSKVRYRILTGEIDIECVCQHGPEYCPVLGYGFLYMPHHRTRSFSVPFVGQYGQTGAGWPLQDLTQPPRAFSAPPSGNILSLDTYGQLPAYVASPQQNLGSGTLPEAYYCGQNPAYRQSFDPPPPPVPQPHVSPLSSFNAPPPPPMPCCSSHYSNTAAQMPTPPQECRLSQTTRLPAAASRAPSCPPPPPLPAASNASRECDLLEAYFARSQRPWTLRGPPHLVESVQFRRFEETVGEAPSMILSDRLNYIRFIEIIPRLQVGPT